MTDRNCAFCRNCLEIDGCDNYPNKGHCPVGWSPTFMCSDCGDVEVPHDGDTCIECVARYRRQQRPVNALINMLFGRVG